MYSFSKQERLCSRPVIDRLFGQGRKFIIHPFIVNWGETDTPGAAPMQVLFAVSSKNLPSAVQRNHAKRLMREAFRKNKAGLIRLLQNNGRKCAVIILYNGKEKLHMQETAAKIILILRRLEREYEKAPE